MNLSNSDQLANPKGDCIDVELNIRFRFQFQFRFLML